MARRVIIDRIAASLALAAAAVSAALSAMPVGASVYASAASQAALRQQNIVLRTSPATEEEPFLYAGGGFRVFVPSVRRGSAGPSGPVRSPALLALGHAGAATAVNPDLISDVFFRVGGAETTEHYQKSEVTWSGQGGTDVFFQNELPYDPPVDVAGYQP